MIRKYELSASSLTSNRTWYSCQEAHPYGTINVPPRPQTKEILNGIFKSHEQAHNTMSSWHLVDHEWSQIFNAGQRWCINCTSTPTRWMQQHWKILQRAINRDVAQSRRILIRSKTPSLDCDYVTCVTWLDM